MGEWTRGFLVGVSLGCWWIVFVQLAAYALVGMRESGPRRRR